MNIIFRRCLGMLNLVLLRRDYYDAEAAQEITVLFHNKYFVFLIIYLISFYPK